MRAHLLLGAMVVLAGCAGASSGGTTDSPVVVEDVYTAVPTPLDEGNHTQSPNATPTTVGNGTDAEDRDDDSQGDAGETATADERDDRPTATDEGTEATADEDVAEFWEAVEELMRQLDNRSDNRSDDRDEP